MKYLTGLLVFSACALFANADVYKVENVGGVPRLTINGEPQRARMLYVSPTYFLLGSPSVREIYNYGWVDTFVEIPPLEKPAEKAQIIFDFRGQQFKFMLSYLEIIEADGGKKIYELSPDSQTSLKDGAGTAKNAKISFEKMSGFEKPVLVLNSPSRGKTVLYLENINLEAGKKYRINYKCRSSKSHSVQVGLAKDGKFLEPQIRSYVGLQTKLAKDAGVDIITFPVQAADFMPEDGKSYDFQKLKGALDEIIAANPQARILLRIRFYPPQWWMDKYVDDRMGSSAGKPNDFASPSSERFRSDCEKVLGLVIDYCEKNYGKNMMGYHPGGGGSSEWYYGNAWGPRWFGYGKAESAAWQKWVAEKYKTDEALQKAWNDSSASLKNIAVPSLEKRGAVKFILNPRTQREIADFNLFLQDEMLAIIERLAAKIKSKVPDKICAFFYGYICDYAGSYRKGPSTTGHYALGKLLKNKNIDMLSGPVTYTERDLGDGGTIMTVGESVTRAGKIWISEDDIRTHRTPPTQQKTAALGKELRTLEDTIQVLQRDMAQQAIRNNGCWWMDLAGTGWYDDPELWKLMPKFKKMEIDTIENPQPYEPEVAVVGDERSMLCIGVDGTAAQTSKVFSDFRFSLNRQGIPFGHYLLDDVLFGKAISPKLYIFAADYMMDSKQRKAVRNKIKNAAALFVWLTAYIDADKMEFSPSAVREATGFDVVEIKDEIEARAIPTKEGEKAGLAKFGFDKKVKPLLSPVLEEGDIVLAEYPNSMPAVVQRGKRVFCGVSQIPAELYGHMIKISGAHQYGKYPLCVYANGAYVSVTCVDGIDAVHDIEIDVNSDREIFDALSGEKLGKGPKITLKMKRGDNRVLRLGKGNSDLKPAGK